MRRENLLWGGRASTANCSISGLNWLNQASPTAPASPWQNGFAERLIGSIRRECLDHVIVFGEAHLRRILKSCAHYYNGVRTHRSLNKDAPVSRSVQRAGVISSSGSLGGLHHHGAAAARYVEVFMEAIRWDNAVKLYDRYSRDS
jgi:hypothetical protein